MRISTKGRYALRLLLDLAEHNNGTPIRVKEIATRQHISEKYLEQIISVLNKAGYVQSIRGAQGGYLLKKEPSAYNIGEILRITEGSITPVSCLDEHEPVCERKESCVSVILWQKISDAVNEVVDNTTLQDLMDWNKALIESKKCSTGNNSEH